MTDAADAPETTEPISESTTATRLLELQRIDTESDQLTNRRVRLAEREQLAVASAEMGRWESRRTVLVKRIDELTETIEKAESEAAAVAAHKARLEAQMKTVIAPREAEALMHEVATLDEQTDTLDMAELEALEEQSDIDDQITAHLVAEDGLRAALSTADEALEQTTVAIDAELADLTTARAAQCESMAESILVKYGRVRASSGVAVAKLVGHLCAGCHLDMSAAEIDDAKDEAAVGDGVAECPNCGRMIIV
ncbi:MAG: putative nucleic acid-binding Zn-ribbon protein [Candidatus Aldehydirespiratoraceae bacterium]|jgi:predicted  nucleic acid-binding Zn-ribbon protein